MLPFGMSLWFIEFVHIAGHMVALGPPRCLLALLRTYVHVRNMPGYRRTEDK